MNTRFDPELSRLSFEDRLIEFCEDPAVPLLERVRLLGIVADRLDVFFMTRVGRLKRIASSGEAEPGEATRAEEQQDLVSVEAHRVVDRGYRLLHALLPMLAEHGIRIEEWDALDDADRATVSRACAPKLEELVHPVVVEETQLFPHIRNLRPALLAEATRRSDDTPCIVVLELPAELPRLVPLPASARRHGDVRGDGVRPVATRGGGPGTARATTGDTAEGVTPGAVRGGRFVPLEQVIAAQLGSICGDLDVGTPWLFRVTRNGDTDFSAEDDVLESVEQEIVWRPFQDVVRLEVEEAMPPELRDQLLRELQREAGTPGRGLTRGDMYVLPGLIDLTALGALADVDIPALKSAPVQRRKAHLDHLLEGASHSALLHFPFDDYETSLERLLSQAAEDPALESMRTTIYRTDEDSDVVRALRTSRTRGADVTAVVEVKASFDESENIEWARMLDAEGVRVVLSPASLKVHAKMALVTFRDGHVPRRIALIGTGNMNAVTSRAYVDLWLVTSDPAITTDVAGVFEALEGDDPRLDYDHLLVAPFNMRRRFLGMIEREAEHAEAGRPSGIRAMMNGLTDSAVIAALHRASQAGVRIDLLVRGVCLLRPQAPGLSENIRIVSVAGQLLQHARIFHFRNGGDDEWFIGSADWRPRNFDRRVEVIAGIRETAHRATLDRMLSETFAAPDAWVLGADGVYVRRGTVHSRAGHSAPVAVG